MDTSWKQTAQELPPQGVVVNTIAPASGMEQTLKYSDNLWWAPDGSMYVYYVPSMWRLLEPEPKVEPKCHGNESYYGYAGGYGSYDDR